jgi:CMP-N-acetylneuraminic acid synthetase
VKTLAIIPARGGSKRLPGKNIRPFLGRPLIHWSIEFAQSFTLFDRIVVTTDSDEIAACCGDAGLIVPDRRHVELATDTANSVDVALNALHKAEDQGERFDYVALLQPTSPIRELVRWEEAFLKMECPVCEAVVGVSPVSNHPLQVFKHSVFDGDLTPWIDRHGLNLRSQDLPPAVFVNGSLYLVRTSILRKQKTFFPLQTKGVLCDSPCESMDIDTPADWLCAEALASFYKKGL